MSSWISENREVLINIDECLLISPLCQHIAVEKIKLLIAFIIELGRSSNSWYILCFSGSNAWSPYTSSSGMCFTKLGNSLLTNKRVPPVYELGAFIY